MLTFVKQQLRMRLSNAFRLVFAPQLPVGAVVEQPDGGFAYGDPQPAGFRGEGCSFCLLYIS